MKKLSRRKFLKCFSGGALGLAQIGTLEVLFASFLESYYNKVIAQELNVSEFVNYIQFSMRGGPPRWQWDLPLTPMGLFDGFNPNPYCVNKAKRQIDGQMLYEYATHQYGGYHVPYLWKTKIPTADGGKANMDNLLKHTLMMRGLNNTSDGHGLNRIKMNQPIPGGASLTGVASDAGVFPIPAVHYGTSNGYKSNGGLNSVGVSGNLFSSLLDGLSLKFGNSTISGIAHGKDSRENVSKRLDSVLELFNHQHRGIASVSHKDLKNAKSIFLKDYGDLNVLYSQYVNKYKDLIQRAITEHDLEGFDKDPLWASDSKLCQHSLSQGTSLFPGVDMRDIFVQNNKQTSGDLSRAVSDSQRVTGISNLAEGMALAEFCSVNNLATSLMLPIDSMHSLHLPKKVDGSEYPVWQNNVSNTNDSHWTGSHLSMLIFGKYFKAVTACTNELVTKMKDVGDGLKGNRWDNTLLHFAAEFPRRPDTKGYQNGHAWNGNCVTLMSGKIEKLDIIGSCVSDGSRGHYGKAGELDVLGGREMLIGNVASTVSSILAVPSPTPNDPTLVGVGDNGKVINYGGIPHDKKA